MLRNQLMRMDSAISEADTFKQEQPPQDATHQLQRKSLDEVTKGREASAVD